MEVSRTFSNNKEEDTGHIPKRNGDKYGAFSSLTGAAPSK